MKRATINDVALTAGVSTFTASRALRGKDHVAAATRDKVLKAAKELNYTASRSAAALASGRTNRIAMLARERLAGWFMGELFDGLYDELSRARYDLTVYRAGSVEERAEFFTRLPANRNADALIVSGFSAGGHLAASLGVFWDKEWLAKETGLTAEQMQPNGLLLSYPVITSGTYTHHGSMENLMGTKKSKELEELLSLEHQVGKQVPPVFIWHTLTDQSVPVQNTLMFTEELVKNQVSVEVHIFPEGQHGLSLANEETQITETGFGIQKRCQDWITLAGKWVADLEK